MCTNDKETNEMATKTERLNLRMEKELHGWIAKRSRMMNHPSMTYTAISILREAYAARNKGENKRGK